MSQSFGSWRASYTPGNWVVLAGPSSLVVMQPAVPRHSELIAKIWYQVAHADDANALVQTLTAIGLSQMPSLGVFFWSGDQMVSLARGSVVVKDASSGKVVNHGDGVLTWREAGLDPSIITVEMEESAQENLVMPLLLGVVQASRLTIDATGTVEPLVVEDDRDAASAPQSQPSRSAAHDVAPAPARPDAVAEQSSAPSDQPAASSPASSASADAFADVDDLGRAPATSADSADSLGSPAPVAPAPVDAVPPAAPGTWSTPPTEASGDLGWGSSEWKDSDEDSSKPWPAPSRLDDQADQDVAPDDWGSTPWSEPDSSASSSQPPAAPAQTAEKTDAPSPSGWGDPESSMAHDGATMFMPGLANESPSADPAGSGLVMASVCTSGHANPPGSQHCRICSAPMDPSGPRLVDRPCLGVLVCSSGDSIDLLGPVLVGRAPNGGTTDPQAALMRVLSPNQDISRTHVRVAPNDWSIEVTDMNSTNGTLVRHPGEESIRLSAGETVTVEIGAVIDLGDGVTLQIAPPRG